MNIKHFSAEPVSLLTKDGRQLVKLNTVCDTNTHFLLRVFDLTKNGLHCETEIAVSSGSYAWELLLPTVSADTQVRWELYSMQGELLYQYEDCWKKPREWTFYVMISSHTDIGLHNSQYYQRYTSEKLLDDAAALCDATDDRPEENRYRYTMEGRWFWENYPADRGSEAAERMLRDYIRPGKIGLCAGIAGNHTHAFGFEEMCRSTYGREKLLRDWQVDTRTMAMIDINGMSWAMVSPYADAGYENIIFAPNQWNPLPSTVWRCDKTRAGYTFNPDVGGGGSRCDVRWDSTLPLLFYWQAADNERKMLVWASTQYGWGGHSFGFHANSKNDPHTLLCMKEALASHLPKMEADYPYDIWLCASYEDDQKPTLDQTDLFAAWNEQWEYPKFRTLGDPNVPFDLVRERFGDQIPTLRGEMTAGWYQHPSAAPQLLADKLEADRRLANAETLASLAAMHTDYRYPKQDFDRAWEYLLWNDEHSYGVSGYQGRRVYETWMQHRDWIEKAAETAETELHDALAALASEIPADEESLVVFNPTARMRDERITDGESSAVVREIPPCGYRVVPKSQMTPTEKNMQTCDEAPIVENSHYRIVFAPNGSMTSIFDKKLGRQLLAEDEYGANCFLFTEDNHKSYVTPNNAVFTVTRTPDVITVTAQTEEPISGAGIVQTVTLNELHHRIEIDNDLTHIRAMINTRRYHRYLYYAFPFAVPGARRICQLNGCEAEYACDLTGHCTDTYMSAHEWALAENDTFGAALLQRDSLLVEFDHIHPDKTDCGAAGDGSAIYSYVSNDWLQMHEVGGSHVGLHLRYAITSWSGSYRDAGIREMAECFVNPPAVCMISAQNGSLPAEAHSFMQLSDSRRLVCLKRAENGDGVIARLYGDGAADIRMGDAPAAACTVDERPTEHNEVTAGFTTVRISAASLPLREDTPDLIDPEKPAPIGSVWTGLITKPRAARGENDGHLYLLWGQNMEENLSHYELYRAKNTGFIPSEETLIAKIEPEAYRVGRYIDEGLEVHTEYFYRVRAVNQNGICGDFSEEFSAYTKESIPSN